MDVHLTGVYFMNVYFTSDVYVRQRRRSSPQIRCSYFIQSCVRIRDFWWSQAWCRISHFALKGNFGGFSLWPSTFNTSRGELHDQADCNSEKRRVKLDRVHISALRHCPIGAPPRDIPPGLCLVLAHPKTSPRQ